MDEFKQAYDALLMNPSRVNAAAQQIGDLGAIAAGRKLGFEMVEDFPTKYHGIDGLMKDGDRLIIVEAKGGAGQLGTTKAGEQLSQRWIRDKIDKLRQGGFEQWADQLEEARAGGKLDVMLSRTPINGDDAFKPEFVVRDYVSLGPSTFNP